MGEVRKDYILDRWVVYSQDRGKRPHEFIQETARTNGDTCPFCSGNEAMTTGETYRYPSTGKWHIRVINNKFPAVVSSGNGVIQTHNSFYTFSDNVGKHEVVVETNKPRLAVWDFTQKHLVAVFQSYIHRYRALHDYPYVCVFKNHGPDAGTSIVHSHSQVIAINHWPLWIHQIILASRRYDSCPYCDIIHREQDSDRLCFRNDHFVAFCPYASLVPFEVWIFPRKHIRSLTEVEHLDALAAIYLQVLQRLKKLNASFNMMLFVSPVTENMHFFIQIIPRLSSFAGFELFGTVINSILPEDAALFYRSCL